MDNEYHQRFGSSVGSTSVSRIDSGNIRSSLFPPTSFQTNSRTYRRLFSSIKKRYAYSIALIPFASVIPQIFKKSNGVVTEIIQHPDTLQRAQTDLSNKAADHVLGIHEKIQKLAEEMHQQALLTPDPNDDKIDFVKYIHDYIGAAPLTHFLPDWLKDIIAFVTMALTQSTHGLIHGIFKAIYNFITSVVLWTPEWLFGGSWFSPTISNFSIISILIVIIFSMIEGLKKNFNLSHTPFRETLKKLPVALGVSALAPILFTEGTKLLNKLTNCILKLGTIDASVNPLSTLSFVFEPFNLFMMIVFIILMAALCVPISLFNARRWFDFVMLGAITPFAMSAWLFHTTEKYFHMWVRGITNAASTQIVLAGFVSLLGLLIFGTPNPTTFVGLLTKVLLMIGGIYRLAFPPYFLTQATNSYESIAEWYRNSKRYIADSHDKIKKTAEVTDKGLIGGARIAGKLWRGLKGGKK
jgi:hypothetical protein